MRAVRVRVVGRVQGVFFRAGCAEEAGRLGVSGWVSNEPDGSVAGQFEGAPDNVAALVQWCRTGPPHARVEHVEVTEVEHEGHRDFETR